MKSPISYFKLSETIPHRQLCPLLCAVYAMKLCWRAANETLTNVFGRMLEGIRRVNGYSSCFARLEANHVLKPCCSHLIICGCSPPSSVVISSC